MNSCRSGEVVRGLLETHKRDSIGVYLPAVANWELTKGSNETLPASLRAISARPEAITFARPTKHLKAYEKAFKCPIDDLIQDPKQTDNIREVLCGLRDDIHELAPKTIDRVRAFWRERVAREEDARFVRELEAVHRKMLDQTRANAIRNSVNADPPDRGPFRDYLAEAMGTLEDLADFLIAMDYGQVTARKVSAFPCFSLLHLFGLQAIALRWRVMGGVGTAKVARLENDMIDVEYATLAAYGSGLISEDAGALATYGDILAVAERLWP
jgi:hypothetical protein